jgi:hypothetical protein
MSIDTSSALKPFNTSASASATLANLSRNAPTLLASSGWKPAEARKGSGTVPPGDIKGFFAKNTPAGFTAPKGQALKADLPYRSATPTNVDRQAHAVISHGLNTTPPGNFARAAAYLKHYMGNTGAPMVVPKGEVTSLGKLLVTSKLEKNLGKKPEDQIMDAVKASAAKNPGQSSGVVTGLTDWVTVSDKKNFEAMGDYSMKLSYRATYKKGSDGKLQVDVSAVPYLQDVYDFERNGKRLPVPIKFSDADKLPKEYKDRWGSQSSGGSITVTVATLQDNAFAELQIKGLAKPFNILGAGAPINFSISPGFGGFGNTVKLR